MHHAPCSTAESLCSRGLAWLDVWVGGGRLAGLQHLHQNSLAHPSVEGRANTGLQLQLQTMGYLRHGKLQPMQRIGSPGSFKEHKSSVQETQGNIIIILKACLPPLHLSCPAGGNSEMFRSRRLTWRRVATMEGPMAN